MIVENKKQVQEFERVYKTEDCIVIPIQCDSDKHPVDTEICMLYVQLMNREEFILPFNHSETLNIEIPNLNSNTKKYTFDKKKLNHLIEIDNVIDVNLLHYIDNGLPLDVENTNTNAHNYFYTKYYKKNNINRIIPVLKHLEYCRNLANKLKDVIDKTEDDINLSYNTDVLDSLSYIEQNGLQTTENKVYSEYNIYTSTGRPSNRFGGTNFAALNKKDGSRKPYVSRFKNGVLVEMDFDAYHLRLIADKVDYDFGKGSVHEHMAKLYGVDYEEAKTLSFQYLYGYLPQDVIQLNAYFSRVYDYIEELWRTYNSKEFILSDIYNKKIYKKNLSDMNKNKVFNYLIQLMETENNMRMLTKLIPKISGYKSKLILYSYDSFLFDFHLDDGLDFIKRVKGIVECKGKYPVKVAKGSNYHKMKDITRKFK